eukprot:2425274-Amphidinium_carterae.2
MTCVCKIRHAHLHELPTGAATVGRSLEQGDTHTHTQQCSSLPWHFQLQCLGKATLSVQNTYAITGDAE